MAQTLVSLLVHLIFSIKHRENWIPSEIESDLYAYFGGIAKKRQSCLLAAGGTANHVHL
ncbi:MAG: transposase, partial [Acidobacteria bacterium]|nr:transposase [Acidobacteriota bacterium]